MSILVEALARETAERRRRRIDERLHLGERNARRMTARQIADHVFMDLVALWVMHNVFDYAPFAQKYAGRTHSGAAKFSRWRTSGTDLHNSLHILVRGRTDIFTSDADGILMDRVSVAPQEVLTYLSRVEKGRIDETYARVALQKFERALAIESPALRAVRRIAQEWPGAKTAQRRMAVTRMVQFYNANARTCEMAEQMRKMGKSESLLDPKAGDGASLGKAVAAHAAAGLGGFALGHRIGKRLGG